jgi:hypothetical protein
VTVNIRNGKNRIEMWTKTAANEALQVGAAPAGLEWATVYAGGGQGAAHGGALV